MNPLPRFLGMALFVVLAVLSALLAALVWQRPSFPAPNAPGPAALSSDSGHASTAPVLATVRRSAQLTRLAEGFGLGVALLGLVLAAALVVTLALRAASATTTAPFPLESARSQMDTLAKLAESSVAQDAALVRERDVRRRTEEDLQLKQDLLAQSVDEKIRLGQDLHDGIIQSLYAVGLTLETARMMIKTDPALAERRLNEIRAQLNAAIRDVRGYITGLAPENLRRASFSRSVNQLFEQLRADRAAHFEINIDEEASILLSEEQNLEALQIAREAISNALRHGAATNLTIRLHHDAGAVGLLIQDNGRGFDLERGGDGGHGLANMRARAARVGASLRCTSQAGQGTKIIVTFATRTTKPA